MTPDGEIVSSTIDTLKYIANDKQEFYLVFASMLTTLMGSSTTNIKIKLLAYILREYGGGQRFTNSVSERMLISKDFECSARSLERAYDQLLEDKIIYKVLKNMYKLNPRHVFKGSTENRKKELQIALSNDCPEC